MKKIITNMIILLILSSTHLTAFENTKLKTNISSILYGALNLKYEVKILDNLSIESTTTLTRYSKDYDILTGINIYLYQNSVINSSGYFLSAGAIKGIRYKDEFYNVTLGYQWYFNTTGIRYTSIEVGVLHKKDFYENDDITIPAIYFNVAF